MRRSVFPPLLLTGVLALASCQGPPGEEASAESSESDDAAQGAAQSESRLLVVNKSGSSLSEVDPSTYLETRRVETGFAPHEVAVSDDGRFAFVTDYGSGQQPGSTVTVVDLESFQVARTIGLDPHTRPHGVAVTSEGTVWVTTEGSAHALELDPVSGEILQAIETGQSVTHMVAVAEAAGRVVTANIGSGTASVLDPSRSAVVRHVETGAGAEGLTVHPDGLRAFVTNREAGTLVELDLTTGEITRSMEVGDFPIRVKVRPSGAEALVSNAEGNEVVAVNLDSWEVVRRLPVGAMPVGILITPDDRTAFVANTQDDKITVIDLAAWEVVGEIVAGDEPDGMAWVG